MLMQLRVICINKSGLFLQWVDKKQAGIGKVQEEKVERQ